jgi:hypothetical protein
MNMKNFKIKHILLVALICIISSSSIFAFHLPSSSGGSKAEFFTFGPKISMNVTNQWNRTSTTAFVSGADLGLFFRFSVSRFYFQPEIYYVIRTTSAKALGTWPWLLTENNINYKIRTHHLEIPILAGIRLVNTKIFKLRFFVGPDFCFKLNDDNIWDPQISEHFQTGFQTGIGVDIWRFTIDAGYSLLAYTHTPHRRNVINNIFRVAVGFKSF